MCKIRAAEVRRCIDDVLLNLNVTSTNSSLLVFLPASYLTETRNNMNKCKKRIILKFTPTFGSKLWKINTCPKRFRTTQLDRPEIQIGREIDVLLRPRTIIAVKRAMVARIMESR
jgi:hypothetical protein